MICEKADKTDIPTIDKKKYLVPSVRGSLGVRVLSAAGVLSVGPHIGSHRRPVRPRYSQAYQARAGEGDFHLRGRGTAANSGVDECYL